MAKAKVILVDADVISHFIASGKLMKINTILAPNHLFVVDMVYKEATRIATRKAIIDQWIATTPTTKILFPDKNPLVVKEYYRLKKEKPELDYGERACAAMAKYGREVIASSNFRDIKNYCDENGIEYIGCMDILYIAHQKGIMSEDECNQFIADAKRVNNARLPSNTIASYTPTRDLSEYIAV